METKYVRVPFEVKLAKKITNGEVDGRIWDYGKYDVCDTIHPKARWAYMKDLIPNTED